MSGWLNFTLNLLPSRLQRSYLHSTQDQLPAESQQEADSSKAMAECSSQSTLSREDWIRIGDIRAKAAVLIYGKTDKDEPCVLSQLKQDFTDCPSLMQCMGIRDTHGYNLLQNAVMQNFPDVVEYLVSLGAEVNMPICGRPLPLAAKLGHVRVVQRLITCGADPMLPSAVCYPYQHNERGSMNYNTMTQTWSLSCTRDMATPDTHSHFDIPLFYAIKSDNLDCVNELCKYGTSLQTSYTPLHLACKEGSYRSMYYFTTLNPKWVNLHDLQGHSPLQLAIKWGKCFIEHLVCSGASVYVKTSNNETLLHLLFKELRDYRSLSESVSYLLQCGLNMNVNTLDHLGHTALHLLIQLLCYPDSTLYTETITSIEGQEVFYREVIQSVKLMLGAKANGNICNRNGDRGLHMLVKGVVTDVPLRVLHEVLELLLQSGANANLANRSETSVIQMFVHYGCRRLFGRFEMDFNHIKEVDNFILCLDLLWRHCCRFSSPRHNGPSCLLHIALSHLTKLHMIVTCPGNISNRLHLAALLLKTVMQVVRALLERGCRPNICGAESSDLHILYYPVMAVSPAIKFADFCDALLVLLHHGADPTLGAINRAVTALHHQRGPNDWKTFPLLNVLNLMASPTTPSYSYDELMHLALMFYSAMGPQAGNRCLKHYIAVDRCPATRLNSEVRELAHNPISLKHGSANTLYMCLDRELLQVDELPLPTVLKEFLKNLQYVKINS